VSRIRNEVQDPKWKQRQENKDSRDSLLATSAASSKEYAKLQGERRNQGFIDDQMSQQQQIIRTQDEDLGALGSTVVRLGQMGNAINDELTHQERMLGDLDESLDRTDGRLSQVMGKVNNLLKSSDRGKLCAIFVLTMVFILLLVAVIYT